MSQSVIAQLNWRAAIKEYDSSKKLPEETVTLLTETARLAPSSFGIQPYKLIVVSDPQVKQALKEAGFNQPQFESASHVFVFASRTAVTPEDITEYVDRIVATRGGTTADLEAYKAMMLHSTQNMDVAQQAQWAARQAYIPLGMMMAVAMQAGIDTSPMEGFDRKAFDAILKLTDTGFSAVVALAAGYRSEADTYATLKKVRKSVADFVVTR